MPHSARTLSASCRMRCSKTPSQLKSDTEIASIDDEVGAGDVGGVLTGKETDRLGDLFGSSKPAHRDACQEPGISRLWVVQQTNHAGIDDTRHDDVGAYIVLRPVSSHGDCETKQPCLA